MAKRVLDIVVSGALVLGLSPLLLLVTYLIRRDSAGPALFKQERVGKDGRIFLMYKFRSMYVTNPKYAVKPNDTDPSVTRVGRFLRPTKIDELPQLFNVLRGEMSLVGPRPEMPFLVAQYGDRERARLTVTPGVTGLWQISPARHRPIHENVRYDLEYIERRSFWLDLRILYRTLVLCLSTLRRHATPPGSVSAKAHPSRGTSRDR